MEKHWQIGENILYLKFRRNWAMQYSFSKYSEVKKIFCKVLLGNFQEKNTLPSCDNSWPKILSKFFLLSKQFSLNYFELMRLFLTYNSQYIFSCKQFHKVHYYKNAVVAWNSELFKSKLSTINDHKVWKEKERWKNVQPK